MAREKSPSHAIRPSPERDSDTPHGVEVSVVVATRNRSSLLPDCLLSLVRQVTTVPFEVVLVDNGSTDATSQVAQEAARRDERIRLVEEPRVGLSRAKNAGVRHARGRLILFTDDDVVLPDDWIDAYVATFDRCRATTSLVGGPVLPITPDLSDWPPWLSEAATVDLPRLHHGHEERVLQELEWLWGANMGAHRELFEAIGGFAEELGRSGDESGSYEDVELGDRVRAAGGELWYSPAASISHRVPADAIHPRSIVRKAFSRGANDLGRKARNSYFQPALPVPAASISAAAALPWFLAASALAAASFRLTGRPNFFELARRSAWGAGWCMAASAASGSGHLTGVARRVSLLGRRLTLRLMPG